MPCQDDAGREPLGDDDPELAAFFAGKLDAGVDEPVLDGGKGLTELDAGPHGAAEEGLSTEDYWVAARLAKAVRSSQARGAPQ